MMVKFTIEILRRIHTRHAYSFWVPHYYWQYPPTHPFFLEGKNAASSDIFDFLESKNAASSGIFDFDFAQLLAQPNKNEKIN